MSKPKVTALEFKHTLLPAEEPRVEEELGEARVTPVRRRVYFFDTPGRHLAERKLFVRARTTEGDDDDSTVKLRSLTLSDVPKLWRADDVRIETDIVGAKQIDSAKLDHDPHGGLIELVESRALEPAILLDKAQRAIVKAALPSGASLKDLEVLGPVDARKWKLEPNGFPYELAVEEWTLPDASRFIELSFKVKPKEQERAARAFDSLLGRLKIKRNREQDPKTQMVIDFFADRL